MMSTVAPHAGAWIETFFCNFAIFFSSVAPHAGAWIETGKMGGRGIADSVAPHAGAWIETSLSSQIPCSYWSPPMRGRGLKLANLDLIVSLNRRPPCGGVD